MAQQNITDNELLERLKPLYDVIKTKPEQQQIELLFGFVAMTIDDDPERAGRYISAITAIAERGAPLRLV
tara:strand:+ start:467 stop:676 length:210 start_codon:yes stop_codon:yes gene_type:complete